MVTTVHILLRTLDLAPLKHISGRLWGFRHNAMAIIATTGYEQRHAVMLNWLSTMQADGGATPGWTGGETPGLGATPKKQRSRWDETPMGVASSATPMMGATPSMTPGATPLMTPGMAAGMETPSPSAMQSGVSDTVSEPRLNYTWRALFHCWALLLVAEKDDRFVVLYSFTYWTY